MYIVLYQTVYSIVVAPGSMHVGQRQHYDIPVQAVDLQSQGSSTEVPPPTVVYPHLSPVVATEIIVFTRPVGNRPMFGLSV